MAEVWSAVCRCCLLFVSVPLHCGLWLAVSLPGWLQLWAGCLVWEGEGRECDCVFRGPSGNDKDCWEDWWSVGTELAPCAGGVEMTNQPKNNIIYNIFYVCTGKSCTNYTNQYRTMCWWILHGTRSSLQRNLKLETSVCIDTDWNCIDTVYLYIVDHFIQIFFYYIFYYVHFLSHLIIFLYFCIYNSSKSLILTLKNNSI